MSHHIVHTQYEDQNVLVHIGWDQPLTNFFLYVENEEEALDEDGEILYVYNSLDDSNLAQFRGDYLDRYEYFKSIIARLKVVFPSQLWLTLYRDMDDGIMGDDIHYNQKGDVITGV